MILDSLLKNTKRTGTPFSILLVDIDQFKSINDTYSHQIGDEVLKFISKTLCDLTRDADFIGRMGGDEFIIVLTNTTYEKCLNVKHKIQSFHKNYSTKDLDVQVNLSIGCAQSDPELTNDEIIHNADIELYEEKHRKYKN